MLSNFKAYIAQESLCRDGDRILATVSGGPDSVVLLHLLLLAGYHVTIAHCNFGLRGKESDGDESFVLALGKLYGVKTFTRSFPTKTYAAAHRLSVQEAARNLRYDWFAELAKNESLDKIALAHHQDDRVETFFINLLRGSGLQGLKSIPVQRGNIIRPLMFAGRQQIMDYIEKHQLAYREDSSNRDEKYLRNAIRNKLLPLINELKPNAQASIVKSIDHLGEDYTVFHQLLSEKKNELIHTDDETTIRIESVRNLDPALFYRLLSDYGFDRSSTDDILRSLPHQSTGKQFDSPSYRLLIDRDSLVIKKNRDTAEATYHINRYEVPAELPFQLKLVEHAYDPSFRFNPAPEHAYFDLDKITFPLTIRRWEKGDRLIPFGMKGSKLVSNLLIDAKMNRFEKEKVWVVLSSGRIIWVAGVRASEETRVDHNTSVILEIILSKTN